MGFSLAGSHLIFFVASVIVAGAVAGAFTAVTLNISKSLSEKCDRVKEKLDTDFEIINDPEKIPLSGNYYLFYIKNTGGSKIETTNDSFLTECGISIRSYHSVHSFHRDIFRQS